MLNDNVKNVKCYVKNNMLKNNNCMLISMVYFSKNF